MKTIVLLPVKNEGWILDYTLSVFDLFADYIIIADQKSEDTTREICAKHPKVKVIENTREGHSNTVRWDLLEEARKIKADQDGNLILCIDADEVLSPKSVELIKQKAIKHGPGTVFSLPWIQAWKNISTQRIDTVWKNNIKSVAFFDNGTMEYEKVFVINDHTSRVPTIGTGTRVEVHDAPLVHLHFTAWNRASIKQVWYRCSELIANPSKARYINNKYSPGDDGKHVLTAPIPETWLEGLLPIPHSVFQSTDSLRLEQIKKWFDSYGIRFFEPLDIWHIREFRDMFIKKVGRNPRVLRYPKILVKLNEVRHWAKRLIAKSN